MENTSIYNKLPFALNTDGACMFEVLPGEPSKNGRIKQEPQQGETCIPLAMELIAKFQNTPYQINEYMRSYLLSCKEFSIKWDGQKQLINFLKEKICFSQEKEILIVQLNLAMDKLAYSGPLDKKSVTDIKSDETLSEFSTVLSNYANSECRELDQCVQGIQLHERISSKLSLLTKLKINPDEKFKEIILEHQAFPMMPSSPENASLANRSHFLDLMIKNIWQDVLHLEYSSWTPQSPIADLKELIRRRGLQVVVGHVGVAFYDKSKIKILQQNATNIIYGWAQGAYKKTTEVGHAIILVGARAKGQEIVYFIDPTDESEVDKPRKIYVMSYERLCNNAMDYRGILSADIPKHDKVQRKFSLMIGQ